MTTLAISNAPDLSSDDYILLGVATCFIKQDGEVHEVQIIEPIPSAAIEAIASGIPTSYHQVTATTLAAVLTPEAAQILPNFPETAQPCDDFLNRAIAAARTYKARSEAQTIVPPGTTRTDFNYSIEKKRVLNTKRAVRTEDNVKQHEYTHKVL